MKLRVNHQQQKNEFPIFLNNFYFHLWTFPGGSLYGITDPFARAAVLDAATGFISPIINFVMTRFFRLKLRIG